MIYDVLEKIANDAFADELQKLGFPSLSAPPKRSQASSQFPKKQLQEKNTQKLSDTKYFRSPVERRADVNSSNHGLATMNDPRIHNRGNRGWGAGSTNANMVV